MKMQCPRLARFPKLKHAFFEEDRAPLETRSPRILKDVMGGEGPLIVLDQVHGNHVFSLESPEEASLFALSPRSKRRKGDGLVTNVPGLVIGVETADCGPVLFYDPQTHVAGICHAGWKGARAGILQETLNAMENLGACRADIQTTLGPTIQHQDYEVGPEFPDLIDGQYDSYFYPSQKEGHHHFNLPQYIQDILEQEGIENFYNLAQNTFDSRFASRRRTLGAAKEGEYFSGLSCIVLV